MNLPDPGLKLPQSESKAKMHISESLGTELWNDSTYVMTGTQPKPQEK
jgi:hypothetical protein